ncbi:unnamed protein product [Microthlaspi erraticum]|uniref:DNA endonuclease activator Ctp1 C-terminal domain-containing protein n=1 Tax=Microthlaspi erraticum TaxID=1685480 RepID=A0A6D2HX82_9BRAS|nr:unnamed protein product [Microthlaspi erraticum]
MVDETVDGIEAKYVSGLSAVMVATIQEAKDRISQIEYIFCSQLFPNFQSKSKTFEKVYSEARLAASNAWNEREKALLSEIEELKLENQRVNSENLKSKNRSDQVQNSIELHHSLVSVLKVKGSDVLSRDGINMILSEVKSLKVKAEFLQEELSKKALVTENLLKKVEHLSTEAADSERKLSSSEEEKQRLTTRLLVFEENVGRLEELHRQKNDELEVLQCKLNLTEKEMLECKQKIADHEKELDGMHMQVKHGSYLPELEALRRQSEEKSFELAMEIKKRKDSLTAYKKLKSQYNFLCKKFGLTTDSALNQSHLEDETNSMEQHERPAISITLERKHQEADKARVGTGSSGEKQSIIKTVQTPITSISPMLQSPGVRGDSSGTKSLQLSGLKRPASIWRDTRSRQSPGGHDPHDDFLDTPIENVKRVVAGEAKHVHDAANKDDSDDETQDMNPKPSPSRQRIQVAETSRKSFKHVEPVRKKADRENLKGIECKQCKKFYDAVLPENEGNGKSMRCEHHEGVSRHRYKYAPPMTPEGFWNIGFESEM